MDKGFSLERYWEAFGDGDVEKGRKMLEDTVIGLERARQLHAWGVGKETATEFEAANRVRAELLEWCDAAFGCTPEARHREAIDVVVTAVRLLGEEYNKA